MSATELMTHRMKERTPILLLGAGFSIGAKNFAGVPLPKGTELSERLYSHFYNSDFPTEYGEKELITLTKIKDNLKELCHTISSEGRKTERNLFIRDVFRGCVPEPFHHSFTAYKWNRIYTLNVDDLVENIFRLQDLPLNIFNHTTSPNHRAPTLIKLHGCVNDMDSGFVFDTEEYQNFTAEQNYLLKDFSQEFLKNDVILLGTEFQEDDLKIALKMYEQSGFDNSGYHYFFISPTINNLATRNQLMQAEKNSSNFHWIKITAEAFLAHIAQHITEPLTKRKQLEEQGIIFIDKFFDERIPHYKSDLYIGKESRYQDFFDGWNIPYPRLIESCRRINENKKHALLALVGKPYVGKTCAAKSALIYFMRHSYISLEIIRLNVPLLLVLIDYLNELPENTKVVIYIDSASYQYLLIRRLFERCPSNIGNLVVINADVYDNHRSNINVFQRTSFLIEIPINEKISRYYAQLIFNKLHQKDRLNHFKDLIPAKTNPNMYPYKKTILAKMTQINDLIEVLYFSSDGRGFSEYYSTILESYKHAIYDQYLSGLCFLARLGIIWIPNALLPRLFPFLANKFIYADFLKQYPDLIQTSYGRTKVMRRRLIQSTFKLPDDMRIALIYNLAIQICDMFSEGTYNEYYEIFQKLLRVKKLHNLFKISFEDLYSLLKSLETCCRNASYFWIQYGIAAQQVLDYENANNHLLYAKSMRPDAYSVNHAFAKNSMERGLYEADKDVNKAHEYFGTGKLILESLIESDIYSDAFLYSVHALVNLQLKMSDKLGTDLDDKEYEYIYKHLMSIDPNQLDTRLKELIENFIKHCESHRHFEFSKNLRRKDSFPAAYVMNEDDYDADLIDL